MTDMTHHALRDGQTRAALPSTDQELATLMDEDTWDWESIEVGAPVENPELELGIVLTFDEARDLGEAARAANLPMNQYIKQTALAVARSGKT